MWNPGKLVIVVIFVVAAAATAFTAWYHYQGSRRAREFWGTTAAVLIAQAPEITALELRPIDSAASAPAQDDQENAESRERLTLGDRHYRILDERDVTKARGVSNIRRALVLDPTFDWKETSQGNALPTWHYALTFRDGERSATVFFDFNSRQVGAGAANKTVLLDPAANNDIHQFFQEQFISAQAK